MQQGFEAHQSGDLARAETLYHQALAANPGEFNALQLLGVAALHQNDPRSANGWFERALQVNPSDIGVLLNDAIVLQDLKRSEDAIRRYGQVLAITPSQPAALNGRGIVLATLHRDDEALADLDHAIRADPNFAEAHLNRGSLLHRLGRFEASYQDFARAVALAPKDTAALYNLGLADLILGRYPMGMRHLDRVLELDPGHELARHHRSQAAWQICDWTDYDARRAQLLDAAKHGRASLNSIQYLALTDSAQVQLELARACRDQIPGLSEIALNAPPRPLHRREDGRVRVCYMSSDFREHAVSYLVAGLIEAHDRRRFEVIGVYFGPPTEDAMHRRLVAAFERFETITMMADDKACDLIRSMDIDILVDLNGATKNARSGIFARRAAPIQVNFLGFPGTMWAPSYDFIIGDGYLVPQNTQHLYAEKVVRLPDTFQPNDATRPIASTGRGRDAWHLPADALVFAVFHAPYKITPMMFAAWMRLLKRVPQSVLWILANEEETEQNLLREARSQGIDRARLVFAKNAPYTEHLERCRHADLVLDTFPFNGGTTTSDVLYAGVPTVTLSGEVFASRMSGSLLAALGVGELATDSLLAYETLAYELANDVTKRLALRERVNQGRATSPLFDTRRFAANLENAFRAMLETR